MPEYWDKIAVDYDRLYRYNTSGGREKIQRKVRLLQKYAHINDQSTVLELGCGTGIFTVELGYLAKRVIGADFSEGMLEKAKQKHTSDNVTYLHKDIYSIGYRGMFDCVVGTYIMMYLNINLVMRQCYEMLKDGGYIAFIEPNILNPWIWAGINIPFIRRWQRSSDDVKGFRLSEMVKAAKWVGFKDVEAETIEYWKITPLKKFGGSIVIGGRK